jgi:flagellin-like protein
MNIKNLFKEDDAVSPVIGVILMVAITVILAAVIASFVLGLGDQADEVQPNSSFNFDYNVSEAGDNDLTITLTNGDSIQAENLYLRGSIDGNSLDQDWRSTESGILDGSSGGGLKSQSNYDVTGVGGFTDSSGNANSELKSGQGVNIVDDASSSDTVTSYELDIVWDTGDDSATLASDDGEA